MRWTNRGGHSVAAVTALFILAPANAKALELSLVETGAEPNTSVGLYLRGFSPNTIETDRLVSPADDVFTNDSSFSFTRTLLKNFNSLSDALGYVQGAWEETFTTRFAQQPAPLDFSIDAISSATINRDAPVLLAPSPGAVIKNNTPFNFAWDYATNGNTTPNHSVLTIIPQFTPLSSLSRYTVTTPSGGPPFHGSGSGGDGDKFFGDSMSSVAGATENRFFLTLNASTAALPLNVQLTLGSYIQLNDAIPIDNTGSTFPFLAPVDFFYSREIAPFSVTLSTVPEPSAVALVAILIIGRSQFRPSKYI